MKFVFCSPEHLDRQYLKHNDVFSLKRRKLTVSDVFNQEEEEDELPKKRKLVPLQYTAEEKQALNPAK